MNATLIKLKACDESIAFVGDMPLHSAWRKCQRGDWMLWIAAKAGIERRVLVMAACACAREALQYVPKDEVRPRVAIETAEAWCRGEATLGQVQAAACASTDATDAAYAAYAAAYAAFASYAATSAATSAASAADYAATSAYYDARAAALAQSAKIVRRMIPWRLVRDALKEMP